MKSLGSVLIVLGGFLGLLWSITRTKVLDDGNRDDRFAHATKMFGSEKESVRLGAAQILFDMALKPEMKHLRPTIADMMCSHIQMTTIDDNYEKKHTGAPSHEIQKLLDLLFVPRQGQEERQKKFWDGVRPNLTGSYLRGANLEGANFKEAKLLAVQLQGSTIRGAMFYGADLFKSELHGAIAHDAVFNGARLVGVQFWASYLQRSQFRGAILVDAQFQLCNLKEADFRGSLLGNTRIYALGVLPPGDIVPPLCLFSKYPRKPPASFTKIGIQRFPGVESFKAIILAGKDVEVVWDEEGKPEGVLFRSPEGQPIVDKIIRLYESICAVAPEQDRKEKIDEAKKLLLEAEDGKDQWGGKEWCKLQKYGDTEARQWIQDYEDGKKPEVGDLF